LNRQDAKDAKKDERGWGLGQEEGKGEFEMSNGKVQNRERRVGRKVAKGAKKNRWSGGPGENRWSGGKRL